MKPKKIRFGICKVFTILCIFFFSSLSIFAQNKEIKGKVIDTGGEPVIGANIVEKGTLRATVTDLNGNFTLSVSPNAVLQVSYIGYVSQEIATDGRRTLEITLAENTKLLEEVVITGYQTISRERVTGSFGVINQSKLEEKLQPELKSMLEGQIPGLVLDRNGKVEIRGVSTFSAVKTPLLVIDGYPVDATMNDAFFSYRDGTFENINANNVESITVLKDAVATSIYGSRAANGVIVISTKKGVEGDPKIAYRGTFSVVPTPDLRNLHKASSSDYIDAEIDLFKASPTANLNTAATQATYILIQERAGVITHEQAEAQLNALRQLDYVGQAEEYLFRSKLSQQHNLSVNGATKNHSYNVVLNYLGTKEHFINSDNNRTAIDFRDEWKINKFLTLSANANVTYSENNTPKINASRIMFDNPSTSAQLQAGIFQFQGTNSRYTPYWEIVDGNGNRTPSWLPGWPARETLYATIPGAKSIEFVFLDELERETIKTSEFQSRWTGTLKVDILKGLSAEIGGNWQRGNYVWKQTSDADSYTARIAYSNTTSRSNSANHYVPEGGIIDERRNINESWTLRSQINFNRDLKEGLHRINALVGNEVRRMTYDNNAYATRVGYNAVAGSFVPVNALDINQGKNASDWYGYPGITLETGEYKRIDNRFVSYYGNGSYEYDNRFIASGSIRLDLTNFFGTSSRYRYRPLWSVGGTYKLSEEKSFDIDFLNRLHVRGSYGIGGNISLSQGPFLILGVGSYNTTTGGTSYSISSPPNDELRWEQTRTTNFGVDLTALDNKLKISLDYYDKLSTDVLAPDAVDPTTGFTNITKNVGTISNKGIEIAISANVLNTRNFKWDITHIFAYNNNKVLKYNVTRAYATSYTSGAINVNGYPQDSFWGGRFAGLDNTGAVQAYKADGTIVPIGNLSPDDVVFLGTYRPKFDLSLTNSFTYKNWNLSAMIISKLGQKYRKDAFTGSNIQNRHVSERWREAGDEATTIYPKLTSWNMDMFYFPYTDVLIGNGNYAKLRDVTLTYKFGKEFTKRIGLGSANIYFQARNLLTITAKGTDIDPESFEYNITGGTGATTDQAYSQLPYPKEFYIGLQISF
ncbi:SusC/RagA family TonB-linked outer membrane protein [Bacteroidia bacterium]|nr:SusC/RagA family TonB-linked outer membrane protein [Bacteroidia bacterium]